MSATDELRRLTDELRKLALDINEEEIRSHSVITLNQGQYNRWFRLDMNRDWLNAWHTELERILQAIAATLGNDGVERSKNGVSERKTCRIVEERASDTDVYWEDTLVMECGAEFIWAGSDYPICCPYCGGKVVK